MRTVRTKVYQFSELSKAAQQTAIDQFRNNGKVFTDFIYDEAHKTVDAFHGIFGTDEGRRSWLEVQTDSFDENVLQLKGLRLQKYIWNNFKANLYKGKYYQYKGNTQTKLIHKRIESKFYPNRQYWGNYYYSAVTFENSCTLTGMCYDHSLLQPIYDLLEKYQEKKDYFSTLTFEELIEDCFKNLEKDIEAEVEYRGTDEAIREELENDENEYTKDGNEF